ncbi:hypothetical protein GOODEAATRI_032929 [Goodea atripinnis]|uniref:Uncharacterized protein n=1 Tax=Goodea atripinnis TaxID=208336 RepID=A0ABV0NQF3_9TELE
MAHLVQVKSHGLSGSQSLYDPHGVSSTSASPSPSRPPMPRQNSDPTSDTPPPPPLSRLAPPLDKLDRSSWLRQDDDMPPKVSACCRLCCSLSVPQRTTSISPALVRKNSPGNGPGLGPRAGAHLIRARYVHTEKKKHRLENSEMCALFLLSGFEPFPFMNEAAVCFCCRSNPDLRRTDISMETPLKRASSGSSSSSSTPSSQGGSNERGECCVFVPPPDVLHLQTGLWVPKEKTRPWANFHYSIALKHILTLKKISRSGNFITFLKGTMFAFI